MSIGVMKHLEYYEIQVFKNLETQRTPHGPRFLEAPTGRKSGRAQTGPQIQQTTNQTTPTGSGDVVANHTQNPGEGLGGKKMHAHMLGLKSMVQQIHQLYHDADRPGNGTFGPPFPGH